MIPKKPEPAITFPVDLPKRCIKDLFITAMESGYSPWVRRVDLKHLDLSTVTAFEQSKRNNPRLVWWGHDALWEGTSQVIAIHDGYADDAEPKEYLINYQRFVDGFAALAKHGPRSLAMFLADDQDGPSADAWLQCVVFGEIRYE